MGIIKQVLDCIERVYPPINYADEIDKGIRPGPEKTRNLKRRAMRLMSEEGAKKFMNLAPSEQIRIVLEMKLRGMI